MLPLLVASGFDGVLLIAAVVIAAVIGKPLPELTCSRLLNTNVLTITATPFSYVAHPIRTTTISKTLSYPIFVSLSKSTCMESKAVWGLYIALCILLAFSSFVCLALWHRVRRSVLHTKDLEG